MDIFVLFSSVFYHFACVNTNCIKFGTIGILLFHCHFLKKIFFALGTKKKQPPSQHLLDKNGPIETL